ncbi:MAG TPA: sensor histidine kinase [Nocardioidaceae bacterium]|nr:sensor histidine kinase [Nocardioidaceae bacterium]
MTTDVADPAAGPTQLLPTRPLRPSALVVAGTGWVLMTLAAYVDSLTNVAQRDAAQAGRGALTAVTGAVLMTAAGAILNARPRHRVGLVLAGLGLVWALDGVAESWSAYSISAGLPGADVAVWFVARFGAVLLLGLPLLLVLYPTGRLMAGRAGAASMLTVLAAATLPVTLLLVPDAVVFRDAPVPGVRTDRFALPLSEGLSVAALTVTRVLALAALLAALGIALARHRRATDAERTQLRWLLWAGIVCVVTVVAALLLPSGAITTLLLTVAVVLTAVSVAIGVLRPDLADVDALVAGTLTYVGVAGVVVGIDLATLAAAGSLLGPRLDERGVTVAVLALAVAVYGPLRSWLGAGVRRLLFGRRGDRYDVVSTLAARLEEARSVDEQLPALAGAVASTFKVPYVRVEVLGPAGRVLSATHGVAPAATQDLDIAYHGERVGRLVLARVGVRSLLSRRDQALLLDLVRQAAIALRSGLLAGELQESRERLVLAREEDRRRIRRDLHDGLGPVLGGVAMRLEAAANAVDADPDTARRLVRQARTEIGGALDDVRRLVHDLRPPALDDLGLVAVIEQQAERAGSVLDVSVQADGVGLLPAAVEVAAFRIVSEALNNVVRHARATRCAITLRPEAAALEVVVADDGSGIADDVAAGVGLLSLRERAEELGGLCEVSCPPAGGTTVRAWLPFGEMR